MSILSILISTSIYISSVSPEIYINNNKFIMIAQNVLKCNEVSFHGDILDDGKVITFNGHGYGCGGKYEISGLGVKHNNELINKTVIKVIGKNVKYLDVENAKWKIINMQGLNGGLK